jgi:predicted Rossmann-fold nucleotide-binding protein
MAEPAVTVEVRSDPELVAALAAVTARGAIALVGGADALGDEDRVVLVGFFDRLAAALQAAGLAVVDGGTDSGVMRLIADAGERAATTMPVVGVLPRGVLSRPTRAGAPIAVAPRHDPVLLVPGDTFGDETSWLFRAADHLNHGPATTIVVNGGQLTLDEAVRRLASGHRVIVVAGSGRAADVLAGAPRKDHGLRPPAMSVLASPNLDLLALGSSVDAISAAIAPVAQTRQSTTGDAMAIGGTTKPGSTARLAALIETLDLTVFQKELLRQRWLEQTSWMSRQARRNRDFYLVCRWPVVLGSLAIPALVSLALGQSAEYPWARSAVLLVSVLVAIFAAAEGLLHFAERWRHYRRTAERLKSLGWQFLMLTGPFKHDASHSAAFSSFSERVEDVLGEDVEGYLGEVASNEDKQEHHAIIH